MNQLEDAFFVTRARDIGRGGVAAVLVRHGRVLAEARDEEPDRAFERARARTEGATLYLSRLPTPAILETLVAMRLARVVVRGDAPASMRARLALAGVALDTVVLRSDEAERESA